MDDCGFDAGSGVGFGDVIAGDGGDLRLARGLAIMDQLHSGSGHAAMAGLADVAPALAHNIAAYGYGEVYARPGLSWAQRGLFTIGLLTAMGDCEPQLKVHVEAALGVGLTAEQIVEALTQAAVYCGFPRALNAVGAAKEVFAAKGLLPVESEPLIVSESP